MKKIISEFKEGYLKAGIILLVLVIVALGITIYNKQQQIIKTSENEYNMAFYELLDYVKDVEVYLAKSTISTTSEQGAETLTNVWKEANLAQAYLSRLPIESQELEKTQKFLNQVSDYSYSLSRKNINNEDLTDEDLKNLKDLHEYSIELENTLMQLSADIDSGRVSWKDLNQKDDIKFAKQVDNISKESFSNMEENFHEYSGLIYDGAFSDHITNQEKKGLTGDDVDEDTAKEKVQFFIGKDNIEKIENYGLSQNANIEAYNFLVQTKNSESINIAISKRGGHIVYINSNREVNSENISYDEANEIGKKYLETKDYKDMKETYYLKQDGIITINYAYSQNGVIMYPDLIKLKIALDNGEVLGLESTGYLNNHIERELPKIKISKEEAKEKLNKELNIKSEGLAVIPTKWKSEIFCYEFKGNIDGVDFLVYINVETGKEEDILVIRDTPNGILTI